MIIRPNQNVKILKDILSLDKTAQDTLNFIFEEFKGKLLGKINRKKLSPAEQQKLKRGLKTLKENHFIINSTVKSCYMLNPKKFIINPGSGMFEGTKVKQEEAFWSDVWAYILLQTSAININSVPKTGDLLKDLQQLWKIIPDYIGETYFHSWKNQYLRKEVLPVAIKHTNLSKPFEEQALNCAELIKSGRQDVKDNYQKYIINDSEMQTLLQKTLAGSFTKTQFTKINYFGKENTIAHFLGFQVAYDYLYKNYLELTI